MAKGRKRKGGKRAPSGQLSRAGVPAQPRDTGTPETARRVQAMKGKGTDALWIDKMAAAGLITDDQHRAASTYRMFREIGYGSTAPKIASYGEMIGEGTLPAWQLPDDGPGRAEKAMENHRRGWKTVHERGHPSSCAELTRVVIDNGQPVTAYVDALIVALDLLHELYFAGVASEERTRVRWAS